MLVQDNAKNFEKPDTGTFIGTVIDVVDLLKQPTKFGIKDQVMIVWVLDKNDSTGQPYRAISKLNASGNEKSKLYELAKGILGTAPAVPFDSEILMGRSNQLVIVKEKNEQTGKEFAAVKVVLPLPAGAVAPVAPQGFIRKKDKPAQNQQQQKPATQQAAPAQAPANPAPVATQPVAAQPAVQPAKTDAAF